MIDTASGEVEELPGNDSVTNLGFARDGQLLVITGFDRHDPPATDRRGRRHWPGHVTLDALHRNGIAGTPEQAVESMHRYRWCQAPAVTSAGMQLADLRIFTEPQQGATYDDLLAVAQRAEQLGFGAFFRSDHYLKMGDTSGLPGPTDAWITLAGIARETTTIRLGTLVTAATFRMPGPLAISVAGVDQMSNGRVELGIGAGWYGAEHEAYGIPFPNLATRFDNLEEQVAIIHGLWNTAAGDTYSYDGTIWQVSDSPALPKPVQAGGPPIIVGGNGKIRTPRLAARYATEFNLPFVGIDTFVNQCGVVSRACEDNGRDPATMTWSAALVVCVGENEADVARRAAAIGREPDELRQNGIAGTPEQAVEAIRRWAEAGAERLYLQVLDLADLDHLDVIADAVATHL